MWRGTKEAGTSGAMYCFSTTCSTVRVVREHVARDKGGRYLGGAVLLQENLQYSQGGTGACGAGQRRPVPRGQCTASVQPAVQSGWSGSMWRGTKEAGTSGALYCFMTTCSTVKGRQVVRWTQRQGKSTAVGQGGKS